MPLASIAESAVEYVAYGWAVVPIPPRTKGPTADGWNLPQNTVSTVDRAAGLRSNIGLAHAYSGTCALDIDDWQKANEWLAARGVNLQTLWDAPDAVRLVSGRPNRGKLIYRSARFASKKPKGSGLELRCATSAGLTVQDVLPPSIHPDTLQPYRWEGPGDWRALPSIPPELQAIIDALNRPLELETVTTVGADLEHQLQLLEGLDPDCDYHEWITVGMALHHEHAGSVDGFALWDNWSARSSKYPGPDKLRIHWDSFGHTDGPVVTLRSLGGTAVAADFAAVEPDEDEVPDADRFKFVPAPEYAGSRSPEWIVKGILPKAGLAVVYGDSGSGKTFVVLDMAACIAQGLPWRGHKVKKGRVAYLCGEGADFFARRLAAHQQFHQSDLANLLVCAESPNLLRASQDYKLLIEQLRAHGPIDVVVIDTLARSLPGGNENASEDMGALIARCDQIHRATGAMVLLVHHTGKDAAKGARGHSSLRAACDAELAVIRDVENATRRIEVGKQKDGPDGEAYPFALQPIPLGIDADGDAITSCVIVNPEQSEQSPLEM